MKYVVCGDEMAKIDRYTISEIGIPQMVLMERAALAVFDYINTHFDKKNSILVVVESGNNGGDGIAVARLLHLAGYDVEVYWINGISCRSTGFEEQYKIAKNLGVKFTDEIVSLGYDVVVDGIFGVGLSRAVLGKQAEAIKEINDIEAFKIAIDIPSGIDSRTGFVHGSAFKADVTITFGAMKLGMIMGFGYEYCGETIVADIGFPDLAINHVEPRLYAYDAGDIDALLPYRKSDSHKGSFGKVTVIGGCKNMAGAPMFSAEAAYRTGCGLVRVCTVEENREIIQSRLPEAMLNTYLDDNIDSIRKAMDSLIKWSDVMVMGPGLGTSEYARFIVEKILRDYDKKLIIDADALNIIAKDMSLLDNTRADIIITPHLMEMSRLCNEKTGEIKENKYEIAKEFANKYGVTVVLKDARTIVSDGGNQAYINVTGNNGMATAGSGDVLTGVIAGLLAQKMTAFEAAKLGVYLHGLAGVEASKECGKYSMIASDIVRSIEKVMDADYDTNTCN